MNQLNKKEYRFSSLAFHLVFPARLISQTFDDYHDWGTVELRQWGRRLRRHFDLKKRSFHSKLRSIYSLIYETKVENCIDFISQFFISPWSCATENLCNQARIRQRLDATEVFELAPREKSTIRNFLDRDKVFKSSFNLEIEYRNIYARF